jgi:AraC family transcriptional regulator
MKEWERIQPAIAHAANNVDHNVPLDELANKMQQSPFHAHRKLRDALRETPKQFTLRVRLDRSASELLTSDRSILEIALAFGFENHETFSRAFQKRFHMSPSAYRKQGVSGDPQAHAALVSEFGPCVGLYHTGERVESMAYEIKVEERAAQPVLLVRKKVKRSDIAATIGAELPKVFAHTQRRGIAVAGFPITRYPETSQGMVTLETGMQVSQHSGVWSSDQGEGEVLAETLPAGLVAVTVHSGLYDKLQDAYGALEEWISANGHRPNGAPWEAYLNDPGDHPNPADWKTEVCWPIK